MQAIKVEAHGAAHPADGPSEQIQRRPVDARQLQVPSSRNLKQNFCKFCNKLVTQFARHLQLKHASEPEVKEFTKLAKKSTLRNACISRIRKAGNFLHNKDLKFNSGILITARQQRSWTNNRSGNYIVCDSCKGSYSKKSIRIHYRKCNPKHEKFSRTTGVQGRTAQGYYHADACERLRNEIFPKMRDIDLLDLIVYDDLIVIMGNYFCGSSSRQSISIHLRYLGKLKKILMESIDNLNQLSYVLNPKHSDLVTNAIKIIAGFNSETNKSPAVAHALITLIKKTARHWAKVCLRKQQQDKHRLAKQFLEDCDSNFVTINRLATRTQQEINRKGRSKIVMREIPAASQNIPQPSRPLSPCSDETPVVSKGKRNALLSSRDDVAPSPRGRKAKEPCTRTRWTSPEKLVILENFQIDTSSTMPTIKQIEKVIKENQVLARRDPAKIKAWISNYKKTLP